MNNAQLEGSNGDENAGHSQDYFIKILKFFSYYRNIAYIVKILCIKICLIVWLQA